MSADRTEDPTLAFTQLKLQADAMERPREEHSEEHVYCNVETESKTEPDTQCSQEIPLSYYLKIFPDSDSPSESKIEYTCPMKKEYSDVAWDTNDNGLFVRMTITDVAKHCLEQIRSRNDAMNVWGLKTNRTLKHWLCFICKKRFPDQKSHMLHLESDHDLGISWDHE